MADIDLSEQMVKQTKKPAPNGGASMTARVEALRQKQIPPAFGTDTTRVKRASGEIHWKRL
jgi:hypothetical protein